MSFARFNDNKLLLSHLFNCTTIRCMYFLNTWRPELLIIMLISSANKSGLDISDMILDRPLIFKRKNKGPITKPWGTPCLTACWNQGECVCTFLNTSIIILYVYIYFFKNLYSVVSTNFHLSLTQVPYTLL